MTQPIRGEDDELIDRLIEAIDSPNGTEWDDLAFYVVFTVGGRSMSSVMPDTGHEFPPGSVGAAMSKAKKVVSREEFFQLLRQRIVELVDLGVEESFLVRAIRDEVGRHVAALADSQAVKSNQDQRREEIEQHATDPDFVRRFRERLAADDPTYRDLSDEEVQSRIRAMATQLEPRTVDDETKMWSLHDGWTRRANELLSDDLIETWSQRRALRGA